MQCWCRPLFVATVERCHDDTPSLPPSASPYFNRTSTPLNLQVVHEMEQAGVEPNSHTFTALLNCLARRRKTFDGFQARLRLPPAADDVVAALLGVLGVWRAESCFMTPCMCSSVATLRVFGTRRTRVRSSYYSSISFFGSTSRRHRKFCCVTSKGQHRSW